MRPFGRIFNYPAIFCAAVTFVLSLSVFAEDMSSTWHAGTWDSTIYNRAEHPRTVGIRIRVVNSETQIPVQGAQVLLKGEYIEEWIGKSVEPQEKEFEMSAITRSDGVVVFALSWQKEYPWRSYFGNAPPREYRKDGSGYSDAQSWIKAVDDIEKIQRIEIRCPKYGYKEIPFNFKQLLEFGQNKDSASQETRLFREFDNAWQNEMQRKDVKFCVLDLGTKFPNFQNKDCQLPEFFAKIRDKGYGTVYKQPRNMFSSGEYPQSECGPYFAYILEDISIEPRAVEVELKTTDNSRERSKNGDTTSTVSDRFPAKQQDNKAKVDENRAQLTKIEDLEQFKRIAEQDPFGIAVTDLKKERAISLGLPPVVATNIAGTEGLIVEYVVPGSPAYQAGLRKDCIIKIVYYTDGYQQHLFDEEDYKKALQLIRQKNAQEVKLQYWQFPQPFNGEIDYNKHLKETKILLKTGKNNSSGTKRSDNIIAKAPFSPAKAKEYQEQTAEELGVPVEKTIDLASGVKIEFVLIPAGEFDMGSQVSLKSNPHPIDDFLHTVYISQPFFLSKYEITQAQWETVMRTNPSRCKGSELPVENVEKGEAIDFCRKLDKLTKKHFRLPTEAEWEYACRAGTQTRFYYGEDPTYSQLKNYAWYGTMSQGRTQPVGKKIPNAFGLYDMMGNVTEWCQDTYFETYYKESPRVDPKSTKKSNWDVTRGGSVHVALNLPDHCASAYRGPDDWKNCWTGFRVIMQIQE